MTSLIMEIQLEFYNFILNSKNRQMNPGSQRKIQIYSKIDLDTRKKLVKLVIEDERSLSKSAAKLGVKLSTAKIILKKYKLTGEYFESKAERARRQFTLNQKRESSSEGVLPENQVLNPSIESKEYNSNPLLSAAETDANVPNTWFCLQPLPYSYQPTFWLPWSI